jgi:hypothetical protein
MTKLKEYIEQSGMKKDFILKEAKIHRNKFYYSLKYPTLLSEKERERLSAVMKIELDKLNSLINADTEAVQE